MNIIGRVDRNGKRTAQTQLDAETYRALKVQAAQLDLTLPRLIEVILIEYVRNDVARTIQRTSP